MTYFFMRCKCSASNTILRIWEWFCFLKCTFHLGWCSSLWCCWIFCMWWSMLLNTRLQSSLVCKCYCFIRSSDYFNVILDLLLKVASGFPEFIFLTSAITSFSNSSRSSFTCFKLRKNFMPYNSVSHYMSC